jgi:hypothetical protein
MQSTTGVGPMSAASQEVRPEYGGNGPRNE